jgi:hypothetical protein|nr:MAG TPA: hypothetical protein [Caudoviricetes sp.]
MTRGDKVFCAVIAFFVLLLISEFLYILTESCSSDGKCRSYTPYTYEVLSVNQYVYTKTDTFGRSKGTELRYAFTYVDMDGALHTVDDFQNLEYGNTKVCVADSNMYVHDYVRGIRYLYLTRDTLTNFN